MAEQRERPRPQGDPLEKVIESNPEENQAQRDSDAPPDAIADGDRFQNPDRANGRGSDANGIPEFDEVGGKGRRKLYDDGADLVSRID